MNTVKTLFITCTLLLFASASLASENRSSIGEVAETMASGGYVYVRLVEDDTWIASQPIAVSVGDKVSYSGGMTMKDFHSRTLNRSFDYILFVEKIEVINQVDADKHADAETNHPNVVETSVAVAIPEAGEIAPLNGGKTISDVYAELEQLKDQNVALRARIMKVNVQIAGKNWVTLQDGTGAAPNNKLIATTSEVVAVGDLVTVSGVIHTNVDLGSGYNYSVLLEEATFKQ